MDKQSKTDFASGKDKYGDLFQIGDYKTLSKKILNFKKNSKNIKTKANKGFLSLNRFDYTKNLIKYHKIIKNIE